jgi:hypothetical protein
MAVVAAVMMVGIAGIAQAEAQRVWAIRGLWK